jgi:hypothetical protein
VRLQAALKNETSFLVKSRADVTGAIFQLCLSKSKVLNHPNIANILAAFVKDYLTLSPVTGSQQEIEETLQTTLILSAH